jgi:hypothetical protein
MHVQMQLTTTSSQANYSERLCPICGCQEKNQYYLPLFSAVALEGMGEGDA